MSIGSSSGGYLNARATPYLTLCSRRRGFANAGNLRWQSWPCLPVSGLLTLSGWFLSRHAIAEASRNLQFNYILLGGRRARRQPLPIPPVVILNVW
ncbi:hypothetical protein KCP69_19630 [Salmonella enterica subsp. enterica]|nr:hypothetical protein KCP69_19630 [Salmonella enterica subsp. enterica]